MAVLRTRFSPAPTGFLHVGSARSALFVWLAARATGGEVLLRVEDTNAELYRPEFLDSILDTLAWLGIEFDGETVFQSERGERYAAATDQLLTAGHAYRCDCTPEAVKARTVGSATPGYDGHCRDRDVADGPAAAVRFRVPDEGTTEFDDVIRGHVSFDNANLEDFVIQRSNGSATFFLPNAVDDVDMEITHVVRGEDLINVTPKVLMIREAIGVTDRPVFAHLPMLVNEQRKKLSKRRDDVAVEEFRARGYLPEAFRNYLAVLGWGPPDGVEIRPISEIIELFGLEDVTPSSAFFDVKKLDHFNAEYIRAMAPAEFTERAAPWLPGPSEEFARLAPELQTRVKTLGEVADLTAFLWGDEAVYDDASWEKGVVKLPAAAAILDAALLAFASCTWDTDTLHRETETIAAANGLTLGKAQAPIRVAVTGRTVGPPLFESMEVLGRERVLARLRRAREKLGG
ncbi:MAG TPA: glutamate--tRNA ligase [Acidimicrobiales bacterium]|nr:glutamate--tRNA ligase [Acidimicrobiales bacterium]